MPSLRAVNFSARNFALDSKPRSLPKDKEVRAGKHLRKLMARLNLSIFPHSPTYNWDLLSVGSAAFFRLPHHRAFSALPFQIKRLVMVLGLTKRCRREFLPKSANQISLTIQSTAKRGCYVPYVPHPSTDLPLVSYLQLRKNLVPQTKTNNKSFSSPAGWSLKTRDLVTVWHFKRVRNTLKPV